MQHLLSHGVTSASQLCSHPHGPLLDVVPGLHPAKPVAVSPGRACLYRGKAFVSNHDGASSLWVRPEDKVWSIGDADSIACLPELRLYFTYRRGHPGMAIRDENFEVMDTAVCSQRIFAAAAVVQRQYILVAGETHLIVVGIRRGKRLEERSRHDLAVPPDAAHGCQLLVVSAERPSHRRVFVASGPSISVHALGGDSVRGSVRAHNRTITALYVREIDSQVFSGAADGVIKAWTPHFQLLCVFAGHTAAVRDVRAGPGEDASSIVLSVSDDHTLRLWHTTSRECLFVLDVGCGFQHIVCPLARPNAVALVGRKGIRVFTITFLHRLFALCDTQLRQLESVQRNNQVLVSAQEPPERVPVLISAATQRMLVRLRDHVPHRTQSKQQKRPEHHDGQVRQQHHHDDTVQVPTPTPTTAVVDHTLYLRGLDCFLMALRDGTFVLTDCRVPQTRLAAYTLPNARRCTAWCALPCRGHPPPPLPLSPVPAASTALPASRGGGAKDRGSAGRDLGPPLPRRILQRMHSTYEEEGPMYTLILVADDAGGLFCLDVASGRVSLLDNQTHTQQISHITSFTGWDPVDGEADVITIGADDLVTVWRLELPQHSAPKPATPPPHSKHRRRHRNHLSQAARDERQSIFFDLPSPPAQEHPGCSDAGRRSDGCGAGQRAPRAVPVVSLDTGSDGDSSSSSTDGNRRSDAGDGGGATLAVGGVRTMGGKSLLSKTTGRGRGQHDTDRSRNTDENSDIHLARASKQSAFFLGGQEQLTPSLVASRRRSLWIAFSHHRDDSVRSHGQDAEGGRDGDGDGDEMRLARFPLSCFRIDHRDHLTHEARDDHTAPVTSLVCHETVDVTLTSSLDGTVRFWDPRNQPLLRCEVSTPVHSCCFHPSRFSVLMGVHRQLHELDVVPRLASEDVVRFRALGLNVGGSVSNASSHTGRDASAFSLVSSTGSEHMLAWQEGEWYGVGAAQPLQRGGSTPSTAPGRSFNLNATMDREQLQREDERARERGRIDERDARVRHLLDRREQARNVSVTMPKSRKSDRRALRTFVRKIHPPSSHVLAIKKYYTATAAPSETPLTESDIQTLRELAEAMPEMSAEPSPLHAQSIARRKYRRRLPIAPDGSIPNSSIWKKLMGEGLRPESAAEFRAPELTEEQRRALSANTNDADEDEDEDEDDYEENALLGLLSQPLESESEDDDADSGDDEDEAEQARRERMERARQRQRESERAKPESPEIEATVSFSRRQQRGDDEEDDDAEQEHQALLQQPGEEEELDDESAEEEEVEDNSPQPVLPPLPRYLTQFRDHEWFKHHYPRAVPSTFNHIRPPEDALTGQPQQLSLSGVVQLLANTSSLGPIPAANVHPQAGEPRGLLFCTDSEERERSIVRALGKLSRHPDAGQDDHDAIRRGLNAALSKKPDLLLPVMDALTLLASSFERGVPTDILVELLFRFAAGSKYHREAIQRNLAALGFMDKTGSFFDLARSWARDVLEDSEGGDGGVGLSESRANLVRQRIKGFLDEWYLKLASQLEMEKKRGSRTRTASTTRSLETRSTTRTSKQSLDFLGGALDQLTPHSRRATLPSDPAAVDAIDVLNHWLNMEEEQRRLAEDTAVRVHTPLRQTLSLDRVTASRPSTTATSTRRLPRVGYARKRLDGMEGAGSSSTFLPPIERQRSHVPPRKNFGLVKLRVRPSDVLPTNELSLLQTHSHLTAGHPSRLFFASSTWVNPTDKQ